MECVCFTLIVDDIVLPHGETVMEVLGGGGPQTLFGYQLVTNQSAAVGLSAGVGPDLPRRCKDWLKSLGVDTSGLVPYKRPTPRAWQVFEEWGRRTQIWRGRDDPCEELYDMLRPKYDTMPPHFRRSSNYHLGIHPLHPPRRLMQQLREAAHENGGVLSIEPYTAAETAARPDQVAAVLAHCDIFSPNEEEAQSIVGPGSPEELALRLLALSPPGGADLVVLRCGPEGVLVARRGATPEPGPGQQRRQRQVEEEEEEEAGSRQQQAEEGPQEPAEAGAWAAAAAAAAGTEVEVEVEVEAYRVPAVADTAVVDVTGCGNAFCGGFLAALYRGGAVTTGINGGGSGGGAAWPAAPASLPPTTPPPSASSAAALVEGCVEGPDLQRQRQRPGWVRAGDLRLAGAWGCVAASFMAEERGVPLTPVADLQDRAKTRLEALLPRVHGVQLAKTTVRREATCTVVAAMPCGKARRLKSRPLTCVHALKFRSTLGYATGSSRAVRV